MKKLILSALLVAFAGASAVQAGDKAKTCTTASAACAAKCKAADLAKAKADASVKGATKLIAKR